MARPLPPDVDEPFWQDGPDPNGRGHPFYIRVHGSTMIESVALLLRHAQGSSQHFALLTGDTHHHLEAQS